MLINISNHPITTWSSEQIAMAKSLWGDVCDVALPNINPYLDGVEVLHKAEEDVEKYSSIIKQYDEMSAFHIMGESVYCFHIIRLLKEMGYVVVASTTQRQVSYDGKDKVSHFDFVKFRKY